jgi:hypothetical protein
MRVTYRIFILIGVISPEVNDRPKPFSEVPAFSINLWFKLLTLFPPKQGILQIYQNKPFPEV